MAPATAVLALVVGAVIVLATGRDDPVPDTSDVVAAPAAPVASLSRDSWSVETTAEAGTFTGVATGPAGGVIIGARAPGGGWPRAFNDVATGEAVAWNAGPQLEHWERAAIEDAGRAVLRSVAATPSGFLIGGAVLDEDGDPVPALWMREGGGFARTPAPFNGPGRINAVRWTDGRLVLLGEASRLMSDNLSEGANREGIVLTGSPDSGWTEVTPPGSRVAVNEILAHDGGWIAVGVDADAPAVWRSSDHGRSWRLDPVGSTHTGVFTDVVVHDDGELTAVARSVSGNGSALSQLFRYEAGTWVAREAPRFRDAGWLLPVGDGVIGGAFNSLQRTDDFVRLWRWDPSGTWSTIDVADAVSRRSGLPSSLRAADGSLVVGSFHGQPAVWRSDGRTTTFSAQIVTRDWERIGPVPDTVHLVADVGDVLLALDFSTPTAFVSDDGGRSWEMLALPDRMRIIGFDDIPGGLVIAGNVEGPGGSGPRVIFRSGNRHITQLVPAGEIRSMGRVDDEIVLLTDGPSGHARLTFPVTGSGALTRRPLDVLPESVWILDSGVLIGYEQSNRWPPDRFLVSVDDGRTWVTFELPLWWVAEIGGEVVLAGGEAGSTLYRFDPTSDPMVTEREDTRASELVSSPIVIGPWNGGLAVSDGTGRPWFLPTLDAEPVPVRIGPEYGMQGIPEQFVSGPGGYVVVAEGAVRVLYRWIG